MIELRQHLGLAFETRKALRIGSHRPGQNLDGHFAIELGVARFVDLAHAAGTEKYADLIWADSGARWQGHGILNDCTPIVQAFLARRDRIDAPAGLGGAGNQGAPVKPARTRYTGAWKLIRKPLSLSR